MAVFQLDEAVPSIADSAWVADNATVLGNVELADHSSVWFGAVLRGDGELIRVGARSNVQDGAIVHTDDGFPVTIGDDVTVGHLVMLHGCTVGDGSLIGIQAVVLNGAVIGKNCLVGAGALVTEGSKFDDGLLILGTPAKAVRPLTPEQIARLQNGSAHYVESAQRFRKGLKRIDTP